MSSTGNERKLRKSVELDAELWSKLGKAKIRTSYGVSELIALAVDCFDFNSIRETKMKLRGGRNPKGNSPD